MTLDFHYEIFTYIKVQCKGGKKCLNISRDCKGCLVSLSVCQSYHIHKCPELSFKICHRNIRLSLLSGNFRMVGIFLIYDTVQFQTYISVPQPKPPNIKHQSGLATHPLLCSMEYNVISCQKFNQNTQVI